jgi:hypothetical protein
MKPKAQTRSLIVILSNATPPMQFKTDLDRRLDLVGYFGGTSGATGRVLFRYIGGDMDQGYTWHWEDASPDEENRRVCTLQLEASKKTKNTIREISESISATTRHTGTDVSEMARIIGLFLEDDDDACFFAYGRLGAKWRNFELRTFLSYELFRVRHDDAKLPTLFISDDRACTYISVTHPPTLIEVVQRQAMG